MSFFERSKRGRGNAKHAILDQYLKAFFAIQCQCRTWSTPVVYIDGFAGPGTYMTSDKNSTEENGSPIVAYQAATEHSLLSNFRERQNTIMLIFVEKKCEIATKLRDALTRIESTKSDAVKEIGKLRLRVLVISYVCR